MARKDKNKMEVLNSQDINRLISKRLKANGVQVNIPEVKAVLESYSEIVYAGMVSGVRITLPKIGEFYRETRKGRKAGYYNVPNSRDEHTAFDKNMEWHKEYMEKAPDWGKIAFAEFPKVKKQLREETEGKI